MNGYHPHGPASDWQDPRSPFAEETEEDLFCRTCDGDGMVPEWDDELGCYTQVECPKCDGEGVR